MAAVVAEPSRVVIAGNPTHIKVPRLGIDLAVDIGVYNPDDGTWTLSGYDAQYATPTAQPNDYQDNTLIYGHNNKHVFGPLRSIIAGDEAQIVTDNGYLFHYIFEKSENIKPDNLLIFEYHGPPILTIQTCTGNWNELRRMYTFKFDKVEKIS